MNYINYLLGLGYVLGYLVIFLILFTESGLFFGFFLPGDSLLFSLGLVASRGQFSIVLLVLVACLGAIIGNSVGYAFGKKIGPALFSRENSRFFRRKHLERAHEFYDHYGTKTIVLARFVPFARTFAPILAGISGMPYPLFLLYTIIGGIGWVVLLMVGGYFLGSRIPNIDHYLLPIVLAIIVISVVIPAVIQIRHSRMKARREQN